MKISNHTTLHVNCQQSDKSKWVDAAKSQGVTFEQWVNNQLNRSVKKGKDA